MFPVAEVWQPPQSAHAVPVFLAEEGYRAHCVGLFHSGVALLLQAEVGAYEGVHPMLHLTYLGLGELLEVAEVEAQIVVADIGALLLHVSSEHLAQHLVQQVGAAVVVGNPEPASGIHVKREG